jgi:hypothetical protein
MANDMGASFMNIELEVRATHDLKPLLEALGEDFSVNYCDEVESGRFLLAGAHVDGGGIDSTPEETASKLCDLIEALPDSGKEFWIKADDRVLDVGLEANLDHKVIVDLFRPETIARISSLNARIAVSVYALDLEEQFKKK